MKMDNSFWNDKYINKNTPWNIGEISTPLKEYIDQIENKDLKILIPGAGNGHEAIYLIKNGFSNVFICDWSEKAIQSFKIQNPTFPKEKILCADFFDLDFSFDLIIEQTFYCALDPSYGSTYFSQMNQLLNKKGKLVGLYFNELIGINGPPFGLELNKYIELSKPLFSIVVFEECTNSIKPRHKKELFAILRKK